MLKETLELEREKVATLVSQLNDNTAAIELAAALEESSNLLKEKKELQEKVWFRRGGRGTMSV